MNTDISQQVVNKKENFVEDKSEEKNLKRKSK
jgi:hypothetical protein